ncbi:SDR family oxidoreductase [Nocardia asteroides]|uniref:3-oxoacyl-[acyl-carrier-protein] reductase MabA n=1 Tax=Nocardia asteroides NBRC 15531 TaxID=1110697 RepID=U5E7K0_NOCAS|nr:SDR family oxidoreductase [Nocardia asteroides]TLF66628.1 SDR family oxidoreductase [Nocardia asteroides NBRC 15531]UGT46272.1 SDR family oxidoreductase [Nocardia asteroides]SFM96625.1 3-oxoacyl-[acyl-carrier protein] reductase [Nocardia asteroides]VEG34929.1 3-oxoacyl-[acyl-carrier-protein] reductase FabG [Nocardia asteroides]GAD82346.1 3-oxoacyl-[acyl-carrier-protein] reductase [Nocardia asteroides NBRC 15531]
MTRTQTPTSNLSFDFAGQSVIVTGGGRGIGLELGRAFHTAGAVVYLVDFDAAVVADAAAEVGCRYAVADVADSASVRAVVEQVHAETGRIDVLVNNAGILRDRLLWKLTDDDYEQVMAVHAGGTFRFTRACVPYFRERGYGRVVNVTSYTGLRGNPGQSNYAMAKAGIIGFTKTAAKELARFGVTVNAISPNAETRMIASIPDDKKAELTGQIPMGRFAEPSEMASAVAFLASAEAGYITGTVLPVDGGISI